MNTQVSNAVQGPSTLGMALTDIKEKIEIKIDPKDFLEILEWAKNLEEVLNIYKTKYEILESKFNNHTHADGTIAIKQEKDNDTYIKTDISGFNRINNIIKNLKKKYSLNNPYGEELNDSNY
jgi:hypothetical protein